MATPGKPGRPLMRFLVLGALLGAGYLLWSKLRGPIAPLDSGPAETAALDSAPVGLAVWTRNGPRLLA